MTSLTRKAHIVKKVPALLGEGSIWHPSTGRLWWVDIEGCKLFITDPETGVGQEIDMGQRIGTVVPSVNGTAVVALQDGLYELDLDTRKMTQLAPHGPSVSDIRFNDGKCDPQGRLWVGSMHVDGLADQGALYRFDSRGLVKQLSDVSISNGICWSEDHKTMYYIDSPTHGVRAYDFDPLSGDIANGRTIIEVPHDTGTPDGMTIDSEGLLWVALWGGAAVGRWDPNNGQLVEKVEVPALNVTSCAFGGNDLSTLFITTASIDTPPEKAALYPEAGSLFAAEVGVRGVPASFFRPDAR